VLLPGIGHHSSAKLDESAHAHAGPHPYGNQYGHAPAPYRYARTTYRNGDGHIFADGLIYPLADVYPLPYPNGDLYTHPYACTTADADSAAHGDKHADANRYPHIPSHTSAAALIGDGHT